MLESEIPPDIPQESKRILRERYPNFCEECGTAYTVAGGWQRLEPGKGLWYEHIDAVLMCPECGTKRMHMSGIDKEKGQRYYRDAPRRYDKEFQGIVGYCEHHGEMKVTKDIESAEGKPLRQYKCPECDRGMAITKTET